MKLNRAKNTVRNASWGMIYRLVTILGSFVVKTIIIYRLGSEYNGLGSLFTSILSVLNLANMGFSSSLVFMMYRAVVNDDMDTFCALLNYFKKVYKYVGLVILFSGLALVPFVKNLVSGDYPSSMNLEVLFVIYLLETSLGYLMFSYNTAIFSAYQREDIFLKISSIKSIVMYVLQVLFLFLIPNYYIYMGIYLMMVIPNNVAILWMARKEFPEISCRGEVDDETKRVIKKRVLTLFGHKVGSTVLVSIDSILISSFLGLATLSKYSNYYYILTAVNALIEIVTNGSIAGIGNKLITDSEEANYKTFITLSYGWLGIVGAAAACMLCMYQPFIVLWVGKDYLLRNDLMILIVVYFFSWMFRIMQLTYRDAAGLWTKDWLKPYVGLVINLIGSILWISITHDISGVLWPTIFVFIFVYFPWEAWALFGFQFSFGLKGYLKKIGLYVMLAIVACSAAYGLAEVFVKNYGLVAILLRFVIAIVIYGIIWVGFSYKTNEFKHLLSIVLRTLSRKK
ncbi:MULTISPECIES: lipopolysaccharide biosynthesis protein [Terrabacteria group]|uniref:lipopolysaccharide biosynthesis protein n=1 Tax=Bacillati TaxID=1783272 RepID=UPI001939E45C|nr:MULTISPECIES: oligosaccharide flippase family protein [Terrabacteria group]MBW9211940.1 oligosaccharide flippase family protein [Trueperella sp. zg.1013]QRG87260.1 oligosaccharide flippase family protein [Bulleidia sp. zg-1006]